MASLARALRRRQLASVVLQEIATVESCKMKKRGKMKIGLFIVCGITLLVLLILYEGYGDKIRMHSDPKAMKEEILKKVPIGSRIEDAKRMMEENGFDCEMMRNSAFSEDVEDDPNRHIVHERADFLSCDKSKTTF